MKEMLLVGRGGEGILVASQILGETFARAGCWVQSFPEFTPERRGAPISAFLRWDETSPIHRRYKVRDCDVLVVVSPSPPSPETLRRVRPGGLIVLNRDSRFARSGDFAVARAPAARIARSHGILSPEGRPLGNVAMLGACVRLLAPDALRFLEQSIASRLGDAAAVNIAAAREGYTRCTRQHAVAGDLRAELPAGVVGPPALPPFAVSSTNSLGNETGAWSLERPLLTDACTACAVCALFCPEGAIARSGGVMTIDYRHCKGCGICAAVCPVRNAVAMEQVSA